mmetsp:Transcript_70613/g.147902  ORF Transcript_70613/g.147902 Transcript_70613/m.147902 type:complete len:268 (-) Transcript_70613:1644-2447(-)
MPTCLCSCGRLGESRQLVVWVLVQLHSSDVGSRGKVTCTSPCCIPRFVCILLLLLCRLRSSHTVAIGEVSSDRGHMICDLHWLPIDVSWTSGGSGCSNRVSSRCEMRHIACGGPWLQKIPVRILPTESWAGCSSLHLRSKAAGGSQIVHKRGWCRWQLPVPSIAAKPQPSSCIVALVDLERRKCRRLCSGAGSILRIVGRSCFARSVCSCIHCCVGSCSCVPIVWVGWLFALSCLLDHEGKPMPSALTAALEHDPTSETSPSQALAN